MKINISKKILTGLMMGMIEVSFAVSAFAAAPAYNCPQMQRFEDDDSHHQRQEERHRREQEEKHRHEAEMKRRPHESHEEWQERQRIENERHEDAMRRIAHDFLDIILDN